jgi:hypothetical protein
MLYPLIDLTELIDLTDLEDLLDLCVMRQIYASDLCVRSMRQIYQFLSHSNLKLPG